MKKSLLLFVAIISLNLVIPQQASAMEEFITDLWIDGVQYGLHYDADKESGYAIVGSFDFEATGRVVVPESIEYDYEGMKSFPVTNVSLRVLENRAITILDLPATIYSVMDDSFSETNRLERLIIRATMPPVVINEEWQEVSNTFLLNEVEPIVYVPDESLLAYKEDTNWGLCKYILPISDYQPEEKVQTTNTPLPPADKHLRNGHLLIERNGKTFNAQGAEVK